MVEVYHVRGMLLEEATLYLLEASGYSIVTIVGNNPTLHHGKSGVEAKCYNGPVGLLVVRNGVGVLNEHPTYSHPTITEAVCDIRIQLLQGKEWKPSFLGKLFKQIQDDYPEMEPVAEMNLQFEFGPLGTGAKFVPQRQKVRFNHGTRPLVLQLAENSLSISTLAP